MSHNHQAQTLPVQRSAVRIAEQRAKEAPICLLVERRTLRLQEVKFPL